MINEEVFAALLLLIASALVMCAYMLAGIRDVLSCIDWDLNVRNLASLYERSKSLDTTEFDT